MSDGALGVIFILVVAIVTIALYFLPSYIAYKRQHHQRTSILLLNIFLGWTLLFWAISLAWAASAVQKVEISNPSQSASVR